MRLINADKMRAEALEPCKFCHLNGSKYCREKCETNALMKLIDNASTVEPQMSEIEEHFYHRCGFLQGIEEGKELTRPHGKWISRGNIGGVINCGRSCSLCGKVVEFSENYCPNCGADMREGDGS